MATQIPVKPAAVNPMWSRSFYAALHTDLVMLASDLEEENYLIRLSGDQIEYAGPFPRPLCIDKDDKELPCFTLPSVTWRAATTELIDDLNPWGGWYVPQETPTGTRYVQHTQGYQDALTAFLRSPEAEAFMDQPWQVGRVRCLLLFPNGSFATASDASVQPIVLPMREFNDAKELRRHLDDQITERVWPGSL